MRIKLGIIFTIFMMVITAKAAVPVSGKIIEESTGSPLEYANIVLLSLPDSAFVSGTVSSENGLFVVEKVNSGKYLLKISYIGFENKLISVDVSENTVDLGDIILKESNTLKEVVVTAKTPPFQSGINGGIVANVSTTLLNSVGTANDVLQRMPGIIADNGKVTVFGKGAPIVYINNRKIRDMSELNRLESSEISTVELITNPGAKYDAEGRAVLIITTKTKRNGFSTQVIERLRQGIYSGDNENINISYTKDKLNIFAAYYHNYTKTESLQDHNFILKNTDGVWKHATQLPNNWYLDNSQQISTGFDFSVTDKQAIGGQYQYYTSQSKNPLQINSTVHFNEEPYETAHSQSTTAEKNHQHLFNAFYNGDFSERFSLHFDFDYMKNFDEKEQHSTETILSPFSESQIVDVFNQTDYNLYASKLTGSYKSNAGLIEFGSEYNNIAGNGYVRSNGYTDNNEFTNAEQKVAAFISYSHQLAGMNMAAGLRYEFTSEQFTEGNDKTHIIDRTYSDLYPNISISKSIKNIDLSLAFNKRTQRPTFTQLNGNTIYINRFVFQTGNPYLNKSNIYEVNVQAIIKPFYFNAGYVYIKNPILLYFKEQASKANAILSTYANFPKYKEINATLNWNTTVAVWRPNYTVGIAKPFFSSNYDGKEIKYNEPNYFFRAYNDFTLPYAFVLSCNFRYQSDRMAAFFESKGYERFDLGLRKSFLDNSLRLNLMVYDIFNWVKEHEHIQIDNLIWNADKKYETRYATLSITYIFNNYKKKYRGQSAAQNDINRF